MQTIPLYEIYFNLIEKPTFLDICLYKCYKMNSSSKLLKGKLNKVIYFLEQFKYGKHEEKLIESIPTEFQVQTPKGARTIRNFYRTKPFDVWVLKLENGMELKCADTHLVYASKDYVEEWLPVEDLTLSHYVQTTDGWTQIQSIDRTDDVQYMADIQVDSHEHAYYTNGILSHNTTTTVAYLLHALIFHDQKSCLVVANKAKTGLEIVRKMKEALEDLPFFLKPGILSISADKMSFENGSFINTAAASKTPATGDSLNILYIDEVALIPANIIDEYWGSVYPTLSSFRGSQIILSSTPRTRIDLFARFYLGATNKTMKGWIASRTDWWEVPEHDDEWLEQQRQDLGDELFKREVELSFDTGDNRLVSNYVLRLSERLKQTFVSHEFFSIPDEISKKIVWSPDFDPTQLTYEDLMQRHFLLMVDTAQGIEAGVMGKKDADYNVINIFEIEPLSPHQIEKNRGGGAISVKDVIQYKQIGVYMDNYKNEEACAAAAKYITFDIFKSGYGDIDNVRILIEMNFNGNNWVNRFKDHPSYYGALLLKTPNGQPDEKGNQKLSIGFKTKSGSHGKTYYCERGADMLHHRRILIRQYDDDINHSTITEMSQFCKSKNSYAGQCCHDDLAVTVLFVSIAQEAPDFILWVSNWLEDLYDTPKVVKIREMLDMYVQREVDMSDKEFEDFYNIAGAHFGKLTHQQNGYGSLITGQNSSHGHYGISMPLNPRTGANRYSGYYTGALRR